MIHIVGDTYSLVCMHTEPDNESWLNGAYCRDNGQTIAGEQAQRLNSQMNRNSLICDLYQRRILKKVLRKGRFWLKKQPYRQPLDRSIKYKQYGIRRSSPTTGPNRNRRCPYCDTICHSKREWNTHHKTEHTKVQCPDCKKLFPTPDALNRHRYIHNESHRFKCTVCDKICAFQSDLDQHNAKHNEEKIWYCPYDDCTRDFKRKSDLTAHEVVHTGEDFVCEFPKCGFTRKDPRLVKRHQRVHTREAKVECPICGEKFVFYMQMKRHRERVHTNAT